MSLERRAIASVFLAALALYLATRPRLGFNSDVYTYVDTIRSGDARGLLNAHHLLYNPTGRVWLRLSDVLGVQARPDALLRVMNAVFGALAVAAFHRLSRRLLDGQVERLLATAGFATCFAVWIFSVDVEVYVPSTLFLILSALALFRARDGGGLGAAVVAGALMGLGALYHQMGALFALPGAVLLCAPGRVERPLRHVSAFWAAGGITTLLPYLFAAVTVHGAGSPRELLAFALGYSVRGYGAGWTPASLPDLVLGHGRSLVFFGFVLRDLQAGSPRVAADIALVALTGLGLAIGSVGAVLGWRRGLGERAAAFGFCAAWYVTYVLFTSWWEPENPEFYVTAMAPFWLLWAGGLARAGARWRGLLAALLVLVAGCNLADILRRKQLDADPEVAAVRAIAGRVAAGAVVLLPPTLHARALIFAPDLSTINVYQACKASPDDAEAALRLIEEQIRAARAAGRRVLMYERAFSREVLRPHPWCAATRDALRRGYDTVAEFSVELPVDEDETDTGRSVARFRPVSVVELRPRAPVRGE